jgi:exodeoxyribonuclease-1
LNLIFYDTETTGTNSAFDQILQFAAIKTDADLNEVGRFEIRSRLLPYVVPSPHALRVTGLTIDDLLDEAHPSHYEMVSEIRRTLAGACPAAFVGYNSLKFDEEFLRQAFYQCLHPPYLTNTGGSRRADALHLIRAAAVLHPGAINIAVSDKGGPSFRLDRLAPANGFNHANAHDALADVEALIHLCRIVRDRCPDLWARFQRFASKPTVEDFLLMEEAFLLLEFHPVTTARYVATAIGSNNANVAYCYDLAIDPDDLRGLSDSELAARLARTPRPLRKVKKNAAPCLCPLDEAPAEMLGDVSPAEFVRRVQSLRADRALVEQLVRVATSTEPTYPPSPYVERQIYDGFWSHADGRKLETFHSASWQERVTIAEGLEDPRLVWLARRLIFVEHPHLLAPEHHASMAAEKASRVMADAAASGGWTTLSKASSDLATMLPELDEAAFENQRRLCAFFAGATERARSVLDQSAVR